MLNNRNSIFKRLLIFFLPVLIVSSAKAQVSGYMGKHCVVSGQLYLSPASKQVNANGGSGLNKMIGISTDYAVGRKVSLGLEYRIYKTAFTHSYDGINNHDKTYDFGLTSNTLTFYYRRFSDRHGSFIAPLGRYYQFDLMFGGVYAKDVNGLFYNPSVKFYKAGSSGIGFSWGKQRILFDIITVNYSVQLAYLVQKKDADAVGKDLSSEVARRLMGAYFVNAKLSMGVLAF